MNRVFYFSGHRLTVFHWDLKKFHGACSFEPDAEGLVKFRKYLDTSEKSPARLLVDVIEEDFRIESAPHVYGKDKKAVIGRLLDRYYRSSGQYTYSEVIGREKSGRSDDKVLIGGITNPGMIDIWKDIIEECHIPLIGIWTLPLVSKNILPLLSEKRSAVLLVSQQVNSNLRQTFFRDGKMLSSRQSVINQDAEDISNIGAFASPEVERTVAYLRNQRLIGADEIVHIHIIGSEGQMESLKSEFKANDLNNMNIHLLNEIQAKIGLDGLSGKFSDGIFTWFCTKQLAFQAHYGNAKEYSQYYYVLLSKALKAASILLALFAMLITEANISSVIEYERSAELLAEQTGEYKKIYIEQYEKHEDAFKRSTVMKKSVDLVDHIREHGKTSPLDFMVEISNVLSQSNLGIDRIEEIKWTLEQYKQKGEVKEVSSDKVDVTTEDPIRHVAIINGRIAISDKNYRGSVSQVNRIISELGKHQRIEHVEAIEMPVEVRSNKVFNDESGLNVRITGKEEAGRFSLRIIMGAMQHEL